MPKIINTLTNQDFAGFDKFRLRTRLGKIKKMYVKMNKINKSNINESGICDFFSPPFSLVMANLAAGSSAGESVLLTLDKRNYLKSKLLRASSGKISYMQETVSLLNQWIGKKNQGWSETDKELKILGKDFKKEMKEKKYLTLKLCQKKEKFNKTKYQKHK